jgi:hypothetical protein
MTLIEILMMLDGESRETREQRLVDWDIAKQHWGAIQRSFDPDNHLVAADGRRMEVIYRE